MNGLVLIVMLALGSVVMMIPVLLLMIFSRHANSAKPS